MIQNLLNTTKQNQLESQYITRPTEICDELENYLNNVFETELKTPNSVLLAYNPFVIKKIVGYLSGRIKMPASIGIAGETASGKSTITKDLIDILSVRGFFDLQRKHCQMVIMIVQKWSKQLVVFLSLQKTMI